MPTTRELAVDKDLMFLLPRATDDEREKLRASLQELGCIHPLIGWEERGLLVDGHRRKALCEDLGIPYEVDWRSFPSMEAAKLFALNLQLGRRNVDDPNRPLYLGLAAAMVKELAAAGHKTAAVNAFAAEHGRSTTQIRRDIEAAEKISAYAQHTGQTPAEVAAKVDAGTIPKEHVVGDDKPAKLVLCPRCTRLAPHTGLPNCDTCADLRRVEKKKKAAKPKIDKREKLKGQVTAAMDTARKLRAAVIGLTHTTAGPALHRGLLRLDMPITELEVRTAGATEKRPQWAKLDALVNLLRDLSGEDF